MNQPSKNPRSIEDLLRRVRENQPGAWTELFLRIQPALNARAAYRLGKHPPAGSRPSDISQDVMEQAYLHFHQFTGQSKVELKAWLNQSLDRRVFTLHRAATRQKRDESGHLPLDAFEAQHQPSEQRSGSRFTADQEALRRLLVYAGQLPETQREALFSHVLENVSTSALAQRMEISPDAVGGLVRRAISKLKDRMSAPEGEGAELSAEQAAVRNAADAALCLYLRKQEDGEFMDSEDFVAEHPECAGELRALLLCLEQLREIQHSIPQ